VKPANLFLTTGGIVKVLDFGLAQIRRAGAEAAEETTAEVTEPGRVLGTVSYMSPEQARGDPVDARSDIFSLGAVLYEMLTGRHPFRRGSEAETTTAILRDAPPDLGRLAGVAPGAIARLVGRCLEKRPEDRFQTASDLALALDVLGRGEEWVGRAPSASRGDVASEPATSTALARPRVWLRRTAGLVALLAVAAAAWLLSRPPPPSQRVVSLTSMRGLELSPTWSPDGEHVAFNWSGEKLEDMEIHIKGVGSSQMLRLTASGPDIAPSW
jgi:serine/threonine protein kinase